VGGNAREQQAIMIIIVESMLQAPLAAIDKPLTPAHASDAIAKPPGRHYVQVQYFPVFQT
jgi:hypothetical protein